MYITIKHRYKLINIKVDVAYIKKIKFMLIL